MVKLVLEVEIDEEFLKKVGRKLPEDLCQFIGNLILEGGVEYGWWEIQPDWYIQPDWLSIKCLEMRLK